MFGKFLFNFKYIRDICRGKSYWVNSKISQFLKEPKLIEVDRLAWLDFSNLIFCQEAANCSTLYRDIRHWTSESIFQTLSTNFGSVDAIIHVLFCRETRSFFISLDFFFFTYWTVQLSKSEYIYITVSGKGKRVIVPIGFERTFADGVC